MGLEEKRLEPRSSPLGMPDSTKKREEKKSSLRKEKKREENTSREPMS